MVLDIPTLMFAGGFAAAMCGVFLLVAWWQHRETAAGTWWAAGHVMLGVGVVTLATGFVTHLPWCFPVGMTLLVIPPALIWLGTRSFWNRPPVPSALAGGALLWTATIFVLVPIGFDWALPFVHTGLILAFCGATAWELVKGGSDEKLGARAPLTVLTILNMVTYSLAIPAALEGRLAGLEPPPLASLFGVIHFETIVYVIGTTLFFVAMMKERTELKHRLEAQTDALTGLANRRAFVSRGERLAERCRRDRTPLAVATFDLDHFKTVNDTFGHSMGDRVLKIFANVATDALRPGDLFSRVGGEEFTAIFPQAGLEAGCAMAERIRKAFEETSRSVDGKPIGATVSAGVTASEDASVSLATMLERSDEALYKAKLGGRNRIECSDADCQARTYPRLVRVA